MAAEYCTTTQVSEFMQRTTFGAGTVPTNTVVTELIENNQDFIDDYTGHAWRARTITNEYITPRVAESGLGIRFDLQHRALRTFTNGTDKIEIWDGTQFLDYVANKTAGFRSDYFVDETNGVVWIRDRNSVAPKGVRFTYRYGETTVNNQIRKACILLTARDVLMQSDDTATFADDGASNRLRHDTRVDKWEQEAMRILDSLKEIKTI